MVKYRRRPRRGRGVLALCGAFFLMLAATVLASSMSVSEPMAPALIGGGGALIGIALGRWGIRQISAASRLPSI